jgi:uncharacterized membrane protein YccC
MLTELAPLTNNGTFSVSLAAYGGALAAAVAMVWALLERLERRACQKSNDELSSLLRSLIERHYEERVRAEERNTLTHDSSMRNVLEHLERALLGKPKS